MDLRRRWDERAQRRADEARQDAPAWFDMERMPWWIFGGLGVVFLVLGLHNLLNGDSLGQRAWAVVGLFTLVPAQFMSAYRLRQSIPLMDPWLGRDR